MIERINMFLFGMEFLSTLLCSLILWIQRHRKGANTRLMVLTCILMGFISYQVLTHVIGRMMGAPVMSEDHYFGALTVNMLAVPLGAIIMKELTNSLIFDFWHIFRHFIVFLLLIIVYALCNIFYIEACKWVFYTYLFYLGGYFIYNLYHVIRSYRRYQEQLNDIYADVEGRRLNWFKTIVTLLTLLTVRHLVVYIGFRDGIAVTLGTIISILLWTFFGYFVHWMRYSPALKNSDEPQSSEISASNGPYPTATHPTDTESSADLSDVEAFNIVQELRRKLDSSDLIRNQELTRQDLAQAIGVPPHKLSKALRQTSGQTLSAYISEYRIELAARLLLTTNENIEQVIFQCGYNTRPPFYHAFQQRFGCTPKEFRIRQRLLQRQKERGEREQDDLHS